MAWTAKITDKRIDNGVASVTLEFTDGVRKVTETYRSTSPNTEWIPLTAKNRISQLAVAYAYDVSVGDVTLPPDEQVDPNVDLFRSRCRLLEIVKIMIDLGVVKADNTKVLQLVNWLKNNFDTYFDTLR